jgi:ribosomal protein S18 acetylase RimI-like enzyme
MVNKDLDVNYRRATLEDVKLLTDSRIRFLNSFFNHPYDQETEILDRNLKSYFKDKLESGEYIAWLAEKEGSLVAISGMVVWQLPPKYNIINGKAGYILNMYTIPEERNKGICTNLLSRLIEDAKHKGVSHLHLHASVEGLPIYQKVGFEQPEQIELSLQI